VAVICFDTQVIAEMERAAGHLETCWLSDFEEDEAGEWRPTAGQIVETAGRIGADGVGLKANAEVLDEGFVATLREADLDFYVWTVNDPRLAVRMIELGVDGITTDRPGWLRDKLSRPGDRPPVPTRPDDMLQ
jgi:glycerophosphoryl diester phosphodiesterase